MTKLDYKHLKSADRIIAGLVEHFGEISLPKRTANFKSLMSIIVSQQLSSNTANAIMDKIEGECLENNVTPNTVLKLSTEQLRSCGLSKFKVRYVVGLANKLIEDQNYISDLLEMDADIALNSLIQLDGFGHWSASIFLMFYLDATDVFPRGDVTLERAMQSLYGKKIPKYNSEDEIIMAWSPYRSLAAFYLWHWADNGKPKIS